MMRRFALIVIVLALASLVAAGCGQYGKRHEGDGAAVAATQEREVTNEKFDDAARKRDGCTEVEEFESEGNTHLDASERSTFKHNPPHSGDHWNDLDAKAPADWGLYDTELKEEQWVHNLEHGHIVIAYNGLKDKQVDELLDTARINPYHLVLIPRKKNPKDGVYYTAWTAQLYCKKPSKAALQFMIDEWRDQGPELFTDDASMTSAPKDS